jgi:hypothetical protein
LVKLNNAPTSAIRLERAMNEHKEYTRQEPSRLCLDGSNGKARQEFGRRLKEDLHQASRSHATLGYWAKLNFGKPSKRTL